MKQGRTVRQVGRRAALIGLGVILAIVLAELGVHLAGPRLGTSRPRLPVEIPVAMIERLVAEELLGTLDFDLGWLPRPGFDSAEWATNYVRVRINQQGLRANREYSTLPGGGIRRLAGYGDSFTFCSDVNFEDCWTHRLEGRLTKTEVLNFGVSGYGPDQAWLRYRREGTAWQPCAVLIGHMVEDIDRVVNRYGIFRVGSPTLPMAKPRFILEGDHPVLLPIPSRDVRDLTNPVWLETNLGPHDAWYFPGTLVANPLDRLELIRFVRTAIFRKQHEELHALASRYVPGTEPFDVLTAVLTGFAAEVRADGATPVVLVFPNQMSIVVQRDEKPKQHAALLAALAQRGVATIDLTDALGRRARRSGVSGLMSGGGHYSPLGNAVVARTLADQLPALTSATCGRG
jgi:hypothetical protein